MKTKLIYLALFVSVSFSLWRYWYCDLKVEQLLTAKEWQSNLVTVLSDKVLEDSLGPLHKAAVESNVKYLPNGTYLRVSSVHLLTKNRDNQSIMTISETGSWSISDNYLLITPTEFKDISSAGINNFTQEQLDTITHHFKMDAQQSRRIDVINTKSLLLTSLSHDSTVLFTQ